MRRRAKSDDSTSDIVKGLRKAGFTVIHIRKPVDLAVTHKKWGKNMFKFLECKTAKLASGKVKLRKDQEEQQKFCAEHGVPYVTDAFEALLALGETVKL